MWPAERNAGCGAGQRGNGNVCGAGCSSTTSATNATTAVGGGDAGTVYVADRFAYGAKHHSTSAVAANIYCIASA